MMRAYLEAYLGDAISRLASALDYAINACHLTPGEFSDYFVISGYAEKFERGTPAVVSGFSGEELVTAILERVAPRQEYPEPIFSEDCSPEYWAGWALAQYAWATSHRFADIFARVPLASIIALHPELGEADINRFIEAVERRYRAHESETKLHNIRLALGLSQSELSKLSGVAIRSIQLYEQRVNDIDKAQAHTLYKLARTLGCKIEDLLEMPEEF